MADDKVSECGGDSFLKIVFSLHGLCSSGERRHRNVSEMGCLLFSLGLLSITSTGRGGMEVVLGKAGGVGDPQESPPEYHYDAQLLAHTQNTLTPGRSSLCLIP